MCRVACCEAARPPGRAPRSRSRWIGIAAVVVSVARLLQLVVHIAHLLPRCFFSSRLSVAQVYPLLSLVYLGQVSVSVRPERLSAAGTTRDAGHHSRLVPISCCWPPRHAALASMTLAAASRFIGSSHCPKALWVRQVAPWLT
jgi:hypothetical protein